MDDTDGAEEYTVEMTKEKIQSSTEQLLQITPKFQGIKLTYEKINWSETEKPGHPSVSELQLKDSGNTSTIKALHAETPEGVGWIYLTDYGVYATEEVNYSIGTQDLEYAANRALRDFSRQDLIKGLRPSVEILPPDFFEHMEFKFSEVIKAYELIENGDVIKAHEHEFQEFDGKIIIRVVLREERNVTTLLNEIRTSDGVNYQKPDELEVVEGLDDLTDGVALHS